jgi:hypothetical protein
MLELGTCLATGYDENGFIGVQIDGLGGPDASIQFEQLSHSYGFVSRPLDPEDGVGCTLYRWQQRRRRHMWLGDDPRTVSKVPQVKKGGSAQYSSDGCFQVLDPETHTKTTYIPYAAGKAHLETVGLDGNGTPIVEYVHGEGMALTMLGRTLVLKNADGNSYIQLDDNGCILNANLKVTGAVEVNGAKILPTGDVVTATGVSLTLHTHLTPLGPTSPPLPTGP